jgi:phenylacetic acid degradation operon negative regulatory protein
MHARSALFDLYGDHLRDRDDQAPVAALVRVLAAVGIAGPAVRTAVSRMTVQGWLDPVELPAGRGYRLTEGAAHRLDDAYSRVYRSGPPPWDGHWHVVLLPPIDARSRRSRVRSGLSWAGYGEYVDGVWISPYPRAELPALLRAERLQVTTAVASHFRPAQPVSAWDLEALGKEYEAWLADTRQLLVRAGKAHADPDEAAFAGRFVMVHEYRKFLFRDPGLPDELLPEHWSGREALRWFTEKATDLYPAADRFVARCLTPKGQQ